MYYLSNRGLINPLPQRLIMALGLSVPAIIIAVLLITSFTYSSFTGYGKNPRLLLPQPPKSSSPADNTGSTTAAYTAPHTGAPPTANSTGQPAPQNLSTQSIGGRGGGSSSTTVPTSPTSTTTSTSTGTSTGSSGLLPATISVPSTNLQAGGKTLISTTPTALTLN